MKSVALILVMFLASSAGAQQKATDIPPVISVRITNPEKSAVEAANKAVAQAEEALQEARRKATDIQSKVLQNYRLKLDLPWPGCDSVITLTGGTFANSWGVISGGIPKGYTAKLSGDWIIFTREFSECHGV